MRTPYNILRHELIGLSARIVEASDPGYECEGRIVSETRNTLTIETDEGGKTVPKNCVFLEIDLPSKTRIRVDGELLEARPEDRLKKKYRIKFI